MTTPAQPAVILAIGDELTTGQCVDTNSAFLATRLGELGIRTIGHVTIADDRAAIADAFGQAAAQADLIVASGGLGPTADDVTRHALADAMGVELALNEACLTHLETLYAQWGRTVSEANRSQTMLPVGTSPIDNAMGTACGIDARLGEVHILCLPGVPHEMRAMFEQEVVTRLILGDHAIVHRALHTYGCAESDLGATLADLMTADGDVHVGTTASAGVISVRITARGDSVTQADGQADAVANDVRKRLGAAIFGEGDQTLPAVVGALLQQRRQTLATAESCTGGLIGKLMTDISGSSSYFLGGTVAYANEVKQQHLDVPEALLASHGAVSEPVAAAMAEGARKRFDADWAVSTTGSAGPTGGTDEKPVGLVFVGLAGPAGVSVTRHHILGPRDIVRLRTARSALDQLRRALLES